MISQKTRRRCGVRCSARLGGAVVLVVPAIIVEEVMSGNEVALLQLGQGPQMRGVIIHGSTGEAIQEADDKCERLLIAGDSARHVGDHRDGWLSGEPVGQV